MPPGFSTDGVYEKLFQPHRDLHATVQIDCTGIGLVSGEATVHSAELGPRTSPFLTCTLTPRNELYNGQWEAIVVFAPISIRTQQRQIAFGIWYTQSLKRRHTGINWTSFISFSDAQESFQVKRKPPHLLGKGRLHSLAAPDAPPKSLLLNQYIR